MQGSNLIIFQQDGKHHKLVNAALCALHAEHIVHGDIKPPNILVATGGSCWRYLLTDFDTAVLLEAGQREHRRRGYTPIYASPELLGTKMISMAGNYWALGMTLLRWLLGGHPLIMHNENEREVRGALTTVWQPPFSVIDNSRLRALIGGLMERFPAGRWGAAEVGSWLNGDPGIVSAGLILANDPPCDEPFHFEDQSVASATDLARALLRRWHRLNDAGECDRLCDWLRTQLQRPDLANYLQGILGNDTLNDDLRLLDFCYELDTRLQPVWRGRALSAANFVDAAETARQGDAESLAWLRSLLNNGCFDFYARRGYSDAEQLGRRLLAGWSSWQDAWREIVAQGAPENARPPEEEALPDVVRALFSPEFRGELQRYAEQMFAPVNLLLHPSWFLHFGTDLGALDEARLLTLRYLDRVSRFYEHNTASFAELGRAGANALANSVTLSALQLRLIPPNMIVRAGSPVIELRERQQCQPAEPVGTHEEGLRSSWGWLTGRTDNDAVSDEVQAIIDPLIDEGLITSLKVRMVRITDSSMGRNIPLQDEVYLALITWHIPEGLRGKLLIRYPGRLFSMIRLTFPRLPARGALQLVLTSHTRIQLQTRQSIFKLPRYTRPIDVIFQDRAPVFPVQTDLLPPLKGLLQIKDDLLGIADKLMPTAGRLLQFKPRRMTPSTHSLLRASGKPAQWQRLWAETYARLSIEEQQRIFLTLSRSVHNTNGEIHV